MKVFDDRDVQCRTRQIKVGDFFEIGKYPRRPWPVSAIIRLPDRFDSIIRLGKVTHFAFVVMQRTHDLMQVVLTFGPLRGGPDLMNRREHETDKN